MEIYEGLPFRGERDALWPSLFGLMISRSRSAFGKVLFICLFVYLIFKYVSNLCIDKERPCGAMRFFSPANVVADDICDAKLAN